MQTICLELPTVRLAQGASEEQGSNFASTSCTDGETPCCLRVAQKGDSSTFPLRLEVVRGSSNSSQGLQTVGFQKGPTFQIASDEPQIFVGNYAMQTICNGTCMELPAVGLAQGALEENGSKFTISCKDGETPSLRVANRGDAFTFPLRLEVAGRSSNCWHWSRGLQTVESVCGLQAPLVHTHTFLDLLEECITRKNLAVGWELYFFIAGNGLELDSFFSSHLIRMFSSFHLLLEANRVFSKLSKPSIFAWSAIISAYAKSGESCQVVKLYREMQNASIEPDGHVSVTVLKACAMSEALTEGERTHACVLEHGLESDVFVSSALINMYSKCGQLIQAHLTFDKTVEHNLVTWNALIAGYVHHGHGHEALWIFSKMQDGGLEPDKVTFLSVVKACTSISALEKGEQIHGHIIMCGFDLTLSVGNSLIDMYAKCGSLQDAWLLFDKLPQQDVVSWSAMIAGYAQHGFGHEALQLFQNMLQEGILPNLVTFICVVNACSKVAALEEGKKVQCLISRLCKIQ